MMYRHTITVYDRRLPAGEDDSGRRSARTGSAIRSSRALPGRSRRGGVLAGRPLRLRLELLDVRPGLGREGTTCARRRPATTAASSTGSTSTKLRIDRAIAVGSVPKYVAVTPDGRYVARQQLVLLLPQRRAARSRPAGARGSRSAPIRAASPSRRTARVAYVAVMGATHIARVNLKTSVQLDPERRRRAAAPGRSGRPAELPLRDAERRRARREDRPADRRPIAKASTGSRRAAWPSRPTAAPSTS